MNDVPACPVCRRPLAEHQRDTVTVAGLLTVVACAEMPKDWVRAIDERGNTLGAFPLDGGKAGPR